MNSNLYPFSIKGRYGYHDADGHIVIPPRYDVGDDFSEGLAGVRQAGAYGYIDEKGNERIPFIYDEAGMFYNQSAPVYSKTGYGIINVHGDYIIPPIYESASSFHNGVALVSLDAKCGFINKNNAFTIPPVYDDASGFDGMGWACVGVNAAYQYIDMSGRVVLDMSGYDEAQPFYEDLAIVRRGSRVLYVDRNGMPVLDTYFEDALGCSQGLLGVKKNQVWGFINRAGETMSDFKYDDIMPFEYGIAGVCMKGKWGFIDMSGNELLPCRYEAVRIYSEKMLWVLPAHAEGYYIRPNGEPVRSECRGNRTTGEQEPSG